RPRTAGYYLSTVKDVRTRVAQARAFGMEGALPLVNAGPTAVARALRDAQKDGADVTKEQAAANANLHYSQERLSTSFQSLAREIESDFAPQMAVVNDAVRKVTTTLRNHQKIADAAFTGISATALALGVAMAGPFVAGFVAANAAVLTVVAAFGAVVTAGTYFYRDWSSWMDGGKSSFGKFYQSVANGWQGIKKQTSSAIHEMAPAWNKFESGAQEVWEAFASLFTEDSDTIRARWLVLTGDASANWTKAMSFMRGEWDSFLNAVKLGAPAVEAWLKGMFHRGWDGAKEAASASWGYIEKGAVSVARYAADRAEVAHNLLTPRGLRNNNPGNIRQWAGAGSDGQFATFGTPEAGLTAMAQNIEAYMHKHGLQSIRQIISRWAPPEDGNLTNEYIAQVAKDMGVNADARLNGSDTNTVASLMHAITRKENGYDPYANLNQSIAGRVIAMQSGAERPVQNHTTIHVTVQAHSKDPHGVARETARALIAATNRGAH
ncbi:hypothetical protein, partial [Acetobacter orientalis]|uniref:hypothetical protein n=2 Tax=Acetobacter orientalis TaxID=146474 RepID=UPI00241E522D